MPIKIQTQRRNQNLAILVPGRKDFSREANDSGKAEESDNDDENLHDFFHAEMKNTAKYL